MPAMPGSESFVGAFRTFTENKIVHSCVPAPEDPSAAPKITGLAGGVNCNSPVVAFTWVIVQIPAQFDTPPLPVPVADAWNTPGSSEPAGHCPVPDGAPHDGVWCTVVTVTVRVESTPGFPGSSAEALVITRLTATFVFPTTTCGG